jgi:hypothetical protein
LSTYAWQQGCEGQVAGDTLQFITKQRVRIVRILCKRLQVRFSKQKTSEIATGDENLKAAKETIGRLAEFMLQLEESSFRPWLACLLQASKPESISKLIHFLTFTLRKDEISSD